MTLFKSSMLLIFCIGGSLGLKAEPSCEDLFSEIYSNQIWGRGSDGLGTSGGGSTLQTTVAYRKFLMDFFSIYDIHSVVDAGCGDWEFSREINWTDIDYLGYDVVPEVIKKNQQKYTAANIHVIKENAFKTNLPSADLLICKDVMQHLSNEEIIGLISQFCKFKYCLITNDVGCNQPIKNGLYRGIDLSQPPFLVKGTKIFSYFSDQAIKEVFLVGQERL